MLPGEWPKTVCADKRGALTVTGKPLADTHPEDAVLGTDRGTCPRMSEAWNVADSSICYKTSMTQPDAACQQLCRKEVRAPKGLPCEGKVVSDSSAALGLGGATGVCPSPAA